MRNVTSAPGAGRNTDGSSQKSCACAPVIHAPSSAASAQQRFTLDSRAVAVAIRIGRQRKLKDMKHSMWRTLVAASLVLLSLGARAHEIRPAVVSATVARDGTYTIELSVNAEALLAGVSPVHQDTDESPNARTYNALRALPADALKARVVEFAPQFIAGLRVEFDGTRVMPALENVDVPAPGDLAVSRLTHIRLRGRVPPGSTSFRWAYPAQYGSNVLRFKRADDADVDATWLKDGA